MRPIAPLGLYWSRRGEVCCDLHSPDTSDPRWTADGWAPVPVTSGHLKGVRYQCQWCAADKTPIIHPEASHPD